jgi:hypothetical protein
VSCSQIIKDAMAYEGNLTKTELRTPKAAALAGIVFALLLIATFGLLQGSVPAEPIAPRLWLRGNASIIGFALQLIPFAGVAFLWFIGVLRDRLREREDRLFSTVFVGSGLLFLALLFSAAAVVGGIIIAFTAQPDRPVDPETFVFVWTLAFSLMNVYAIKMAGVFMISTSTVALHTRLVPRYIAFLGFGLALFLLLGSQYWNWSFFVFPLWVLLLSIQILIDNFRSPRTSATEGLSLRDRADG